MSVRVLNAKCLVLSMESDRECHYNYLDSTR